MATPNHKAPSWARIPIALFPIALVAFFVFNTITAPVQAQILTDVVIIAFATSQIIRKFFIWMIQRANAKTIAVWGEPFLGRPWLFTAYLWGILIAGFSARILSNAVTASAPTEVSSSLPLTIEAFAVVVILFIYEFIPERRRITIKLRLPKIRLGGWLSRRHLKPRRKSRWVGIVLLVILIPSTMFYVWAVETDYYIPWLYPGPAPTHIPLSLYYPDVPFNQTAPCVGLNIDLYSNGTLSAGSVVKVDSAVASLSVPTCENVAFVVVTIQGSFPYPTFFRNNSFNAPSADVVLFYRFGSLSGSAPVTGPFNPVVFPVSGEYSPTVIITFYNNTKVLYTYNEYKISVASSIDVQNAKNARIQTLLTNIIILFAIIEAISITIEHTKEKETQSPQTPQPTPSATNPPQTEREKSSERANGSR